MRDGTLLRLPDAGTALEQDERLLTGIYIAWRTWFILEYKQMNHLKMTRYDDDFMRWLHSD